MVKRLILLLLGVTLVIGIGPAAARDEQHGFWTCPAGVSGQTLNVYNWTTYIAEDTISNFEELCGVTVVYDTYASDSEMQEALEQGNTAGYDVVVPTDSTVYVLVAENLLKHLNLEQIPNFFNVSPQLKNPPYDPNNQFTVPYQWGTIGIGYNKTKVGKTITSWNDMFDYQGPVAWLDDERAMLGIALKLLGYDPNSKNADEVAKAADYLKTHASNLKVIAPDDGQDRLAKGEEDMVVEYSGDILHLIADCKCNDFAYVIPQEGTRVWVDNMAIPVNAPHPDLAEAFIDYVLDSQVGADISNFTAYASPNQAAIDNGLIEQSYLSNASIYPDANVTKSLFYVVSSPEIAPIFTQNWDALKATLQRNP